MRYLISASKRTDIPAFYSEWFINRIRAGYAMYRNPFNLKQAIKISLKPEDILAITFWTRNPEPLIKYLDELKEFDIPFYFHFTINSYPRVIDPSTPNAEKTIDTFKYLADKYSPKLIQWRYDPIIFNSVMTPEWHLLNFENISSKLKGYTNRCYFSFVDFYQKTKRKINEIKRETGWEFYDNEKTNLEIIYLTKQLNEIALSKNIVMYSCAEPLIEKHIKAGDLKDIQKASCVDVDIIHELFPERFQTSKIQATRESCGCYPCKDIGAYDSCMYKCIYCYANTNFEHKSKTRLNQHDPMGEYLIEEARYIEKLTDLSMGNKKGLSLFDH